MDELCPRNVDNKLLHPSVGAFLLFSLLPAAPFLVEKNEMRAYRYGKWHSSGGWHLATLYGDGVFTLPCVTPHNADCALTDAMKA